MSITWEFGDAYEIIEEMEHGDAASGSGISAGGRRDLMTEGWVLLRVSELGIIICLIGLLTCKCRFRRQRQNLLDRIVRE